MCAYCVPGVCHGVGWRVRLMVVELGLASEAYACRCDEEVLD